MIPKADLLHDQKPMLCTRCLTEAAPVRTYPGSTAMEIILFFAFCIPGLIYILWRNTSAYDACPACGARELVSPDSPIARKLKA